MGFKLIVTVAALVGVAATAVVIAKKARKCTYEQAISYVSETIKDILLWRYTRYIHMTRFPDDIKREIENLLSPTGKKRWKHILRSRALVAERGGRENNGLAYYMIAIPWKDDYEEIYRSTIEKCASYNLACMGCTIKEVVITFEEFDIPGFCMCHIRYARTASEQEIFQRLKEEEDEKALAGELEVRDPELDAALEKFRGDCK